MDKNIEKYLDYLQYEKKLSKNTLLSYKDNLKKFALFFNGKDLIYLTTDEIRNFLYDKNIVARTRAHYLTVINSFYNYLVSEKIIKNNPVQTIKLPRLPKKLPEFLTIEEVDKLLNIVPTKIYDYRNIAMMETLYATGIRVSELINIKINDIDFNNKTIKVMGKGKKERIVFFGDYAFDAINAYLKNNPYKNEYLVLNNKGNKITVRGVELIIEKISKKACINNNAHPHTFRHTFATHMLNNGCPLKSVQEYLGHSSLASTEVYTHITNDYIKEEYLKNMPRK